DLREPGEAIEDVLQDWDVGGGALGTRGGGVVADEPAAELQELGSAVLVGGDRGAECEVTEVLQQVVELIEARVALKQVTVTQGEVVGGEGGEAEQVIGAVHHHVDGEVVAGEYLEIRADAIAQGEPFPFQ